MLRNLNRVSKDYVSVWISEKKDMLEILTMLINRDYTIEQLRKDLRLYEE